MFSRNLKPALLGEVDLETWCKAVEFARELDWHPRKVAEDPLVLDVVGCPAFEAMTYAEPGPTYQEQARTGVLRAAVTVILAMSPARFALWTSGEPTEERRLLAVKRRALHHVKRAAEARLSAGVLDIIDEYAPAADDSEKQNDLRDRWMAGLEAWDSPGVRDLDVAVKWVFRQPWSIARDDTGKMATNIPPGWNQRFQDAVEALTEKSPRGVAKTVVARAVQDFVTGPTGPALLQRREAELGVSTDDALSLLPHELHGLMRAAVRDRGLEGLLRLVATPFGLEQGSVRG